MAILAVLSLREHSFCLSIVLGRVRTTPPSIGFAYNIFVLSVYVTFQSIKRADKLPLIAFATLE